MNVTRMEALRLELRGGGLDARARRIRRQLWNSGVLRGGKLSNGGRVKLGGGCKEARSPAPPP
ncbi:phosphatidylinositol glycan, class V, isoform CRA_c [Rattus norvegicus]|uniref:Phosphatidylinositol glycan, class V, isoform CRA_c n=1 Tax=Rattus norvegicus TaxID=10116 RepID=A6ISY5_RAT|nr:phosphatidylinositol glycan, class V, isoform CRA_c [Rattus norvegicus]